MMKPLRMFIILDNNGERREEIDYNKQRMKTNKLILFVIFIACTACAPVTPSERELNQQLTTLIGTEKENWKQLKITSYKFHVRSISAWQDHDLEITVKNGIVTNAGGSCAEGISAMDDCDVYLAAESYKIDSLFDIANKENKQCLEIINEELSWNECFKITFDARYHFPKQIYYDPKISGGDWGISITGFEELE
jgi:hypothetical protein